MSQAIAALDQTLPKGERRYEALRAELVRRFGDCRGFTSPGLTAFEAWTGYAVRGEPAVPL